MSVPTRSSVLLLVLLPAVADTAGILYPGTYPTPDQMESGASCGNGESFQTDASFLQNETNAVERFLQGFEGTIGTDAIRRTTVACLAAQLEVSGDVPAVYAKGLFAAAGSYKALVRVNSKAGAPPGMRMSVKVFGLGGMEMLDAVGPNDAERGTMDMIFEPIGTDSTSSLEELAAANQRAHAGGMAQITALLASKGITSRRLGQGEEEETQEPQMLGDDVLLESEAADTKSDSTGGRRLTQALSEVMFNMNMGTAAATRFGSSSEPAAKLFWKRPAFGVACRNTSASGDAQYASCLDAMKPAFEQALSSKTLDFPIYANLQGCGDKLEAAGTAWSTSHIQQVALLVVKASQDKTTCDNLAYTPWHGLKAHKPLGSMQRTRKDSYYAAAVARSAVAGAAPTLPASSGILYPNHYPTPDQQHTQTSCKNGEMYLSDSSSFLDGERNAVDRFLQGWKGSLAGDTIRRTTVACLAAQLVVPDNSATPAYQKGLFATAGTYPALLRVNSKTGQGMRLSVKVFGLESMEMLEPVGPNDAERGTMDMIFEPIATSATTSLAEIAAANQRSKASGISQIAALLNLKGITSRRLGEDVLGESESELESESSGSESEFKSKSGSTSGSVGGHRRLQGLGEHSYNMNMGTGAATRFGSSTEPAAKFFVKHAAFSVSCLDSSASGDAQYAPCLDGIKPAFEQALSQGTLNLPIYANLQGCSDMLEASSSAWSTDSIAQVATLMVMKTQETSTCDNLAFTPWHAPKAHKPVGNMQRTRKDAYYAAAVARGAVAGVAPSFGSDEVSFASPTSASLAPFLLAVPLVAVASWLRC